MNATPSDNRAAATDAESDGGKPDPTPAEVLAITIKWLRDYAPEWLRRYWDVKREKMTRGELATVVLTFLIAVAAFWSACVFQGQLKEARRATNLSEIQWKAQNRPWIGTSSPIALPKQLVFLSYAGSKPYTGVELDTSLSIKNFGVYPAFKAGSHIELLLTKNMLTLPQNEMISACSAADQAGIGESVIFPNTEITQGFEMQQNQPIALQEIQRLWAIGCISYLDRPSIATRHTKFWVVSQMLQDKATPSFIRRENRGGRAVDFYSLPVSGWLLLKTEAD